MKSTEDGAFALEGKQLFLDNRFISESQGLEIRTNPPQLRGPVLWGEMPCEGGWGWVRCVSVLQDGDVIKMWYKAHPPSEDGKLRPDDHCYYYYAVSHDGIHWEQPELGLVEFEGSKDNSILPLPPGGDYVFLDPRASTDQRYKALVVRGDPSDHCFYIAHSPDGIQWQLHAESVLPFYADTQNQVFYDPRIGKYVGYLRAWAPLRKVVRVEMESLLEPWPYDSTVETYKVWPEQPWTLSYELPVAISCDELDPPDTDVYTPAVSIYPWAQDAYVAFPSIYQHFPKPPHVDYSNDGLVEIQLAVSRDGVRFERPDRRPYIPVGVKGGREAGSLYMSPGLARIGDEIYHYYIAFPSSHAGYVRYEMPFGAICLAVQRLDGFRSADAAYSGGWLTTPLMAFSGRGLELNIDCRGTGQARVEIRDEKGVPIKGFTIEECDPIWGNDVHRHVTWSGKGDVSALAGKPIRLHFGMRNTKLYAFEFIS